MSDTSQGAGWWQASDDKWYPPETHPDRRPPPPPREPPPRPAEPTRPVVKQRPTPTPFLVKAPGRPASGSESDASAKRPNWWRWIVLAVVIVVVVIVVVRSQSGTSHNTTFAGVVTGGKPINARQLSVAVVVKNTGGQTGTPTCVVTASSPEGAHRGTARLTAKTPLAPGQEHLYITTVAISGNGAKAVQSSGVSVSC